MTEHYVTLFDSGFLPNGLALHSSLTRHGGDFRLWIVTMDDTAHDVLGRLALPGVETVRLADIETPALLEAKADRTLGEYCWTLTPFTPSVVFDRVPDARRATYIDADMWLAADPSPVFAELDSSGAGVLITDHAYAPEYRQAERYGTYCVQFMPFVRERGDGPLRWWQERVLEWCYAREEDGRFGDQKYLDDWPQRFGSDVHVLLEMWRTQAPWNAVRFPAREATMFHFHRLRISGPDTVSVGLYRLPREHQEVLYRPYLADLRAAWTSLESVGYTPRIQSPALTGVAGAKDRLAFVLHNWRSPWTPYEIAF